MQNIADRYNESIEDCLKIFYEVSCDRQQLIQVLKNASNRYKINERKKDEMKRVASNADPKNCAPSEKLKARYAHYEQRFVAVKQWQTLEDLALKNAEATPSFKFVLQDQGREVVDGRKDFLEVDQRTTGLRL